MRPAAGSGCWRDQTDGQTLVPKKKPMESQGENQHKMC